jgi:hypothetical protein
MKQRSARCIASGVNNFVTAAARSRPPVIPNVISAGATELPGERTATGVYFGFNVHYILELPVRFSQLESAETG